MSDVCIQCAGKSKDYRSEAGHLTYDPQFGTVLEPHERPTATVINAEQDLAVLYRKAANVGRRRDFLTLREANVLRTSVRLMRQYHTLWPVGGHETYFTPTWLPEARNAYYGLPR